MCINFLILIYVYYILCVFMQITFSVPFALASIYCSASGAGQGKAINNIFIKRYFIIYFFKKLNDYITSFFFFLQNIQVYL
jgi:hypothetical protein